MKKMERESLTWCAISNALSVCHHSTGLAKVSPRREDASEGMHGTYNFVMTRGGGRRLGMNKLGEACRRALYNHYYHMRMKVEHQLLLLLLWKVFAPLRLALTLKRVNVK